MPQFVKLPKVRRNIIEQIRGVLKAPEHIKSATRPGKNDETLHLYFPYCVEASNQFLHFSFKMAIILGLPTPDNSCRSLLKFSSFSQ